MYPRTEVRPIGGHSTSHRLHASPEGWPDYTRPRVTLGHGRCNQKYSISKYYTQISTMLQHASVSPFSLFFSSWNSALLRRAYVQNLSAPAPRRNWPPTHRPSSLNTKNSCIVTFPYQPSPALFTAKKLSDRRASHS